MLNLLAFCSVRSCSETDLEHLASVRIHLDEVDVHLQLEADLQKLAQRNRFSMFFSWLMLVALVFGVFSWIFGPTNGRPNSEKRTNFWPRNDPARTPCASLAPAFRKPSTSKIWGSKWFKAYELVGCEFLVNFWLILG